MAALDVALVHHLTPSGGAYRVLAEYVAHRPGHRFTVYTRMPEPGPGEALTPLPDRVEIRRFPLPEAGNPLARLRDLRALPERGRELAAIVDQGGHDVAFVHASLLVQNHEVLPFLRTPAVAYAPEPMRSVYEPPARFGPPPGLGERLARAGLHPYERLRRSIDRKNIRAARRIVTHSRFTAGELRRAYGVDAEVVELGVDADAFASGPRERTRSVLSVGALHPLKGHQFVIEALGTVPADRRPPLVVVADRGPLDGPLRELAARLGVQLELRQKIPFAEVVAAYRSAGVLACGQIREPFGLITLEAMAAGTPAVAVDEGGLRETVEHERTGLLTPRDPSAFGQALVRALDDRALSERLVENGLRAVRERWTWERTAEGYDRLLREAASSSRT